MRAVKSMLAVLLAFVVASVVATCGSSASQAVAQPGYRLTVVARRLPQPMYLTAAPGGPDRLYVALRAGTVRILQRGRLLPGLFLDIRDRVQDYGEMGLLSIAFHPRYAANGLVYAAFNDAGPERPVTIVEYHVENGRADPTTARVLARVPHPDSPYHNGGQLQFGPDGKLYVSIGDGGYIQGETLIPDPHGNAQNLGVLLGKIFRLDVEAASPNPEIVAYGLRNPWRFSFAPGGDAVIGDVGWNQTEEVDVLRAGSGLVNFGWSVYEGRRPRPRAGPLNPAGTLTAPALTYPTGKNRNCSIIGGYVYRGRAVRSLRGRYVFGDYCTGRIWSARISGGRASGLRLEPVKVVGLNSFGESPSGELYAVSLRGTVYRFARR